MKKEVNYLNVHYSLSISPYYVKDLVKFKDLLEDSYFKYVNAIVGYNSSGLIYRYKLFILLHSNFIIFIRLK